MTYIVEQDLEGIAVLEEPLNGEVSIGEGYLSPQAKEVEPSTEEQIVAPDSGYDCLGEVIVKAVPYEESQNSAGGITVKIG
ncbi:MAG: hypothetical protein IJA50_03760 [Firmicutes bacterium]|nr:hypothetical protein [Bacillota bacterium]